jgi:hypothetical protein
MTVLLRNPPVEFSHRFPDVKVIQGDYDSFDLIANAAEEAGITVRKSNHISTIEMKWPVESLFCSRL